MKRHTFALSTLACLLACSGARAVDPELPPYSSGHAVAGRLTSIGDPAMKPLMDALVAAFHLRQTGVGIARPWKHDADGQAFGALMFELSDLAPLAREPLASELAPYAHQFAGDMMKSPLLVRVGKGAQGGLYIAVNKRPGSPLPARVKEFLLFALSRDGQGIVEEGKRFRPLDAKEAEAERAKLEGYLATLDPALPVYHAGTAVRGEISSVGSDGMKTLMDRWMRDFMRLQPGVRKGSRWEHLGTLNGFHAMMVDETDIAPMGRELWPDEAAAYAASHGGKRPLEIRVARGGFDTPQRTTAQAIFVNQDNPLAKISVPELAAILGSTGRIRTWGDLGLTGEWKDRPITVYMPPRIAPNAMSMQAMVLHDGAWNPNAHEGSIAETAAAAARDPSALAFGGFEEGGPGLKTLAVAARDGGDYVAADGDTASSGRYPLTRYMYIRLDRTAGEKIAPAVKEFLRYVLSRDAQERILYSGYFPLRADEVKEELAKLR
jgi:ABC-type phosphate transport system substrate-binding protein